MRHNVRDLYKSNMFTEISSPRPPKRLRSSFFMDSDMMDDELPHLEASKKPPKDMTVSSPMEAMTPLAEDALDSLDDDDAQPDLHLSSQSAAAAAAAISRTTRSRHVQEEEQETLVEQGQHGEQTVTPKSPLKHQKQVKSAPQTPLPLDNSMNGMRTRQKSARLKQSPAAKSPATPTHVQQQQASTAASPQRLTRRQAKLIQENGGKPDFAVPVAPLPPPPTSTLKKCRGRAPKCKEPKPEPVEAMEPQPKPQPLQEAIVQMVPSVESQPEQAIVEQLQQESQQVVNADDAIDVDMIVDDVPKEQVVVAVAAEAAVAVEEEAMIEEETTAMIEEEAAVIKEAPAAVIQEQVAATMIQKNQLEPTKAEKSEKELQEEKLRAYRKKKSDAEIKQILQEFPQLGQYYQLIERAGSGTFSRVYKAKDLLVNEYMPSSQANKVSDALGQDDADAHYVAIKLIFDISTPERVANEIRCLSLLEYVSCT